MPEDLSGGDEPTQNAPDGGPDQAPADVPAVDWESDDNPYKQRYGDARPELDRRGTKLDQYEQFFQNLSNPETQAEALRAFDIELQEAEEEAEQFGDPEERFEQRFSQIEGFLQSQADREAEAEVAHLEQEYLDQEIGKIEKAEGNKLSDKERTALQRLGDSLRDGDGIPDYDAAHKMLSETFEERRQRHIKSKKSEVPGIGTAGSETIDMANADSRANALANMIEAGENA